MKPIEQKQVDFSGAKITAVLAQDSNDREQIYIPLRPLVEGMGLDWAGQYRRIKNDAILNEECMSVDLTHTDIPDDSKRPKTSRYLAIPINRLNGFLFGINANRVRKDLRPLLIEYQRNCYEVLFDAFNGVESMVRFYQSIGHDEKWIGTRIEKHKTSTDLDDLWLLNGLSDKNRHQLQDAMNKGTFGLSVSEHKQFKGIPENESLEDHMTRPELLISALVDEAAAESTRNENPQTFEEHQEIAKVSGKTGKALTEVYESQSGRPVLSNKNHLDKKRPSLEDGE